MTMTEINLQHDKQLNFKRSAMVLFALEQSLGSYVRENVSELSELPKEQTQKFVEGPKRVQTVEGLIQETYVGEILDLAIAAATLGSDQTHLRSLKKLADCLELFNIRNAIAHPNRPFPDCYWYRLAAIANDPIVEILGFTLVKHAFESAITNNISLPPDDWFSVLAFTIPNNLPTSLEHEITGLIGREKEKTDLLRKLKSKRFGLVALLGPGGTGKTAIALDLLRESTLDPKTYEWADEIVFITAKTERLTKDGPIAIDNPVASIEAVADSITRELSASNELRDAETFAEVCDKLAEKKIFLCVDNLETLLRDHPESFDEFYSSLPENWRVLVTSRVPVESATNIAIQAMRPEAANALARNYLQKRGGAPLEAAVFTQLVEKTDRNPLAIRISVDGLVSGLDVSTALSQTRDNILDFSYTNLLKNLPAIANNVLECLFAANRPLTRTEIRSLLDEDIDQIAVGVQALLRTSLIARHTDENMESYGLSSSIRDLLLRNPLDEKARTSVFQKLAEQQNSIAQIKAQDHIDPLAQDFIPQDFPTAIAHETFRAFQMVRRQESKAIMADQLERLRGDLHTYNEPALYRASAALLLGLNDRDSARQMLEQALERNTLDSATRLMLAEMYKNENRLEECYKVGAPLRDEKWFENNEIDRVNLGRLARVTWLVGIWLGHAIDEIKHLNDWKNEPSLRAIKGSMYSTALRRLLENEANSDKVNSYLREILESLDHVFQNDGYIGFVVLESVKAINEITRKGKYIDLTREATEVLIRFVNAHLISICSTHRTLSLEDAEIQRFIETVETHAKRHGLSTSGNWISEPTDDPMLSQYGYILVRVYAPPTDSFGFPRSFLFAEDSDGQQYHVKKLVMQEQERFNEIKKGDSLLVLPRDDYEEGKARPVKDAMFPG